MAINLKQPEIITASYRIVTPMFIGDARQHATGISPASVKGALRFWWRALQWGQIRSKNKYNSDSKALERLHKEEGKLFGSTSYNNKKLKEDNQPWIGQSRFRLQVSVNNLKNNKFTPSEGHKYLLGQGLYHFKDGLLRGAITEGELTIFCHLHKSVSRSQRESLEKALLILGMLGGLGSRSRKGFGSLSIISINLDQYAVPQNIEEFKGILYSLKQIVGEPPFTAFSKLTKIDISLQGNKPLELLNDAGNEQQLYRSWGNKQGDEHKVGYKKAEQNFPQSHDLMLDVANGIKAQTIPDKTVFGLPQNYFFSSTKKNVEFSVKEKNRSRRASPLFIHVHQFPNGKYGLVHTLLPAEFLKDNTTLEFKVGKNKQELKYHKEMTNWQIIDNYLARFNNREIVL